MLSSLKRAKYFAPPVDAWLIGPYTSVWKNDPALFDHGVELCFGNGRRLFFSKNTSLAGSIWQCMIHKVKSVDCYVRVHPYYCCIIYMSKSLVP